MPFTELHYENADLQLSTQYMFMARTWIGTIICCYMRTNCCPLGYQSEFPLGSAGRRNVNAQKLWSPAPFCRRT